MTNRAFGCPVCLAVVSRPWPQVYCAHTSSHEFQAINPSLHDPEGPPWDKMVELPKEGLLYLIRDAMVVS